MFGIVPHVCFYVSLISHANKLVYVKNNKYRKVIAIGMIYFDVNFKTQSYIHQLKQEETPRQLLDDEPIKLDDIDANLSSQSSFISEKSS